MTPETPLDEALASAGASLKRLKICFDVDGKLVNYDRLWKRLEGKMVALQVLHVDPHPQVSDVQPPAPILRY